VVSETNLEQFREVSSAGRFTLQNSAMLKISLEGDQIQAKLGSMVAYQGDVRFEYQSGGLGRFFKKAVTGEGVKLMTATGSGELFLAQDKRKIMILDLNNEQMTVNGENILAFEPGIDWDIRRVEGAGRLAGGLFNVVLDGTGKVAVTSDGEPVLLDTSTPTFADPDSAIAWSGGPDRPGALARQRGRRRRRDRLALRERLSPDRRLPGGKLRSTRAESRSVPNEIRIDASSGARWSLETFAREPRV
jgi:uncharacterized protein (AIM24 family)